MGPQRKGKKWDLREGFLGEDEADRSRDEDDESKNGLHSIRVLYMP